MTLSVIQTDGGTYPLSLEGVVVSVKGGAKGRPPPMHDYVTGMRDE